MDMNFHHKTMTTYADTGKYENNPLLTDPTTATVWVCHLHLNIADEELVLKWMSALDGTTGEYISGDSWVEWGEPSLAADDYHLAVYFTASPKKAYATAAHLATHAFFAASFSGQGSVDMQFHVSTAGDFAEQVTA